LAASLKSRFGEEVEIKTGRIGQFDVLVDDTVIFSKSEASHLPHEGEIEERFAMLKAGQPLPALEPTNSGPIRRLARKLFG